jgi:Putative regulator of cell autolysis
MQKLNSGVIRYILLPAVICIAFLIWFHESYPDYPQAKNGVLDLTHWDFDENGKVALSGQWESEERNSHSTGYGTYHMKVKVPASKTLMAIYIRSMSAAYQLYINGQHIAGSGKSSPSPRGCIPQLEAATAVFAPPAGEFDITVKVSDFPTPRGGQWRSIEFGTAEQIQKYNAGLKYRDGIILGILSIMAVYFFCCFFMYPEDRKNLSFMLMCIIMIIRTCLFGDCLLIRLFPSIPLRLLIWLSYLTLVWFPVILYQMIEFYINEKKEWSLGRPLHIYAVIISIITSLAPISFYMRWSFIIDAMAISIFIASFDNAFFSYLKQSPGATAVLLPGTLMIGIAGLHDILCQAGIIDSRLGELAPVGLVILMLLHFLFVTEKASKVYREIQALSLELAERQKSERNLIERLYEPDQLKDQLLPVCKKEACLSHPHLKTENDTAHRVLAIDNDHSCILALTNILQPAGFHVTGAVNGQKALSLIEGGCYFDLVILGVILPGLSGYQVLEILRKKYKRLELPVLMLISKYHSDEISLCFQLGANDYLVKPFRADELIARVNSLVKLKRTVTKLVVTELCFLQAQIKPHFIHNALSVISSLSIKDPYKAKSLILDLSDYLRGSFDLNNNEGMTTLSKELELIQAYLSIEQARFKDRLKVRYLLEKNLDCTIPVLTIQPLVENSIRHGIMSRVLGGEIRIITSVVAKRVKIEVQDNGTGIDSAKIEKLLNQKLTKMGVGIPNIHRRLVACYGDGLHIVSAPDKGTSVFFYIPVISSKEVYK